MFWRCELWQDHVKEGCFPDCDMLPLGKVGGGFETGERDCQFTRDEQRTMMTLWCMFRSPLMIGAELTKLNDFTLSLLTNKELLSLLDSRCHGEQLWRNDRSAAWKNVHSETGELHAALFNLSDEEQVLELPLAELYGAEPEAASYELTELWDQTKLQITDGCIRVTVPAHGCKLYRVCEAVS